MPTLCVLRHAKSDWDTTADDRERPLAPRGLQAAPLVGAWLREQDLLPALVLASAARRARETVTALGDLGEPEIQLSGDLYLAAAGEWLERLRKVPSAVTPVLVVGHNPGLHQLVVDLCGGRTPVVQSFPTAALAVLETERRWADLAPGTARLTAFVRPSDLA